MIIAEEFNTSFSTMNTSYGHKISNKTLDLNYTLGRIHPTDTYRTLHLKTTEYTIPS